MKHLSTLTLLTVLVAGVLGVSAFISFAPSAHADDCTAEKAAVDAAYDSWKAAWSNYEVAEKYKDSKLMTWSVAATLLQLYTREINRRSNNLGPLNFLDFTKDDLLALEKVQKTLTSTARSDWNDSKILLRDSIAERAVKWEAVKAAKAALQNCQSGTSSSASSTSFSSSIDMSSSSSSFSSSMGM